MIANSVIQSVVNDIKNISKIEVCVVDLDGSVVASAMENPQINAVTVRSFIDSMAESQVIDAYHYFKIMNEGQIIYVLVVNNAEEMGNVIGRLAVSQFQTLVVAYREKFDKNNFFQNLIMDNLLLVDIYNRAKKLKIPVESRRAVFLIEKDDAEDVLALELVKNMYSSHSGDYVTAIDEKNIILIKGLKDNENYANLNEVAKLLVDMLATEAMINVRVSYGNIVKDLKEVSKSYKEASMALDVGKIFYSEKSVIPYNTLGIGRLIYQLPVNLCQIFMKEVFGDNIPSDIDEETLNTIYKFFENNLNVSETSRQLYVHRNTLVYRIEKLQKTTGLDIRIFDDALTLKIALMVVNYMKYIEENKF